ncbi:MAG: hypothetical protein K0S00_4342 [Xanthobacteraceae bacterium]|jgi:hypothetical protein|nr:hypothetical protein [Xanthobacteraceae bacterium]
MPVRLIDGPGLEFGEDLLMEDSKIMSEKSLEKTRAIAYEPLPCRRINSAMI